MSDVADVAEGPADRLAAPLWRLASRVLGDLAASEAPAPLAAVRAFTDAPSPARYLAATRVLREAERRHKLGVLGRVMGDRRKQRGLDVLTRVAGVPPEVLDVLRELPVDPRNGRRLALISDLLTAHRLLESRAAGALRELQQSLGPVSPPTARGERRQRRRAGATR
jgi:hypothetical protein